MSITYLKNAGANYTQQTSFFPEFEKVVETGLDRYGKPCENGEYVRVTGWEGMISHTDSVWCSSMEYTTKSVYAYNPYTKKTFCITSWSSDWGGEPDAPTFTKGLKDEYAQELRDQRIAFVKGRVRESFDYQSEQISKFDDVIVARGRKVPVGTKGFVFWEKEGAYGLSFGIKQDDGEVVFVSARNCERDPETIAQWDDGCEAILNEEIETYATMKTYGREMPWDLLASKILRTKQELMRSNNEAFHKLTVQEWKKSRTPA